MIYDLETQKPQAINYINSLSCKVEIKQVRRKRTPTQNRALHLFFEMVADGLNNIGLTFNYTGLKGINLDVPYTPILVKETLWKPIQLTLYGKESTTEINTNEINAILDVIIKFFGEKEYPISFPNRISEYENALKNKNNT